MTLTMEVDIHEIESSRDCDQENVHGVSLKTIGIRIVAVALIKMSAGRNYVDKRDTTRRYPPIGNTEHDMKTEPSAIPVRLMPLLFLRFFLFFLDLPLFVLHYLFSSRVFGEWGART